VRAAFPDVGLALRGCGCGEGHPAAVPAAMVRTCGPHNHEAMTPTATLDDLRNRNIGDATREQRDPDEIWTAVQHWRHTIRAVCPAP